jgi:hypothetical protein
MPQHANPGGNQEPNAGNNENLDPNQPYPPHDQQNPAPQPDVNQQQGNAGQNQPPQPQQQPNIGQRQQQVPPPNQQQQAPDPDATKSIEQINGNVQTISSLCSGIGPFNR